MIENLIPPIYRSEKTLKRSIAKTISYRVIVVVLDFIAVYLFTGKLKTALGFTIVSNIYTTIIYFFHERIWDKIKWGKKVYVKPEQ
ncbi:putative membrane protein [Mucilaginibacter sp. UYNi724]